MSEDITDEAVEAAANELYRFEGYWGPIEDSPLRRRKRLRVAARRILEAAAPHMAKEG